MATDDPTAHHVGITVRELDRAVEFYRDVLGLTVDARFEVSGEAFETAVDVEGASARFVHLEGDGVRLELVEYDPAAAALDDPELNRPGATHLGLSVDDVDGFLAELPDAETVSEPQTTATGTRVVFLRDPEGNLVELLEA